MFGLRFMGTRKMTLGVSRFGPLGCFFRYFKFSEFFYCFVKILTFFANRSSSKNTFQITINVINIFSPNIDYILSGNIFLILFFR